jgi:hypothetical protein
MTASWVVVVHASYESLYPKECLKISMTATTTTTMAAVVTAATMAATSATTTKKTTKADVCQKHHQENQGRNHQETSLFAADVVVKVTM